MTVPDNNLGSAATLQVRWDQLLNLNTFSLGPFTMTINRLQVRVYHTPSSTVYYFEKNRSREQMQHICHALGYSLEELFRQKTPKSYQELPED